LAERGFGEPLKPPRQFFKFTAQVVAAFAAQESIG
jgi:hypothetical protein